MKLDVPPAKLPEMGFYIVWFLLKRFFKTIFLVNGGALIDSETSWFAKAYTTISFHIRISVRIYMERDWAIWKHFRMSAKLKRILLYCLKLWNSPYCCLKETLQCFIQDFAGGWEGGTFLHWRNKKICFLAY